jgi:hypothetical protein
VHVHFESVCYNLHGFVTRVMLFFDIGDSLVVAVVTESGELWTYGDSKSHMLGKAKASGKQTEFVKIDPLNSDVDSIACGFGHHMAAFVNTKE